MQIEPVRRRSNGTIDIDSYRREALMLREQTRTEFFTKLAHAARPFFGGMMFIVVYAYALHLIFPGPAVAEVPDAIAVPGEVLVTTLHAAGAQIYECKAELHRQARLAIPRTDRDFVHGGKDGRAALRRPKLGNDRWQRGAWKGRRAIARCDGQRHCAPETRSDVVAQRRTAQQHFNGPETQHPGRCRHCGVRLGRHISERAVHGRLCFLQKSG